MGGEEEYAAPSVEYRGNEGGVKDEANEVKAEGARSKRKRANEPAGYTAAGDPDSNGAMAAQAEEGQKPGDGGGDSAQQDAVSQQQGVVGNAQYAQWMAHQGMMSAGMMGMIYGQQPMMMAAAGFSPQQQMQQRGMLPYMMTPQGMMMMAPGMPMMTGAQSNMAAALLGMGGAAMGMMGDSGGQVGGARQRAARPAKKALTTTVERMEKHKLLERKRRERTKDLISELQALVPGSESGGDTLTMNTVLEEAISHLKVVAWEREERGKRPCSCGGPGGVQINPMPPRPHDQRERVREDEDGMD